MNTSTERYSEPATGACCLTIKTGRSDCYAVFNPTLFQLTLVQGERSEKIELGFSGSRLLERLLQVPGEVVSRDELMSYAWADRVVGQGSLNQQIYTLRQVLGDEKNREIIQTLPRRGYQINPGYLTPSANDSEQTQAANDLPMPAAKRPPQRLRRLLASLAASVAACSAGLFALLSNASQPATSYISQVKLESLDIRYIEQSPERLEQLTSATRSLSERLAELSTQRTALTFSLSQDIYKLVCQPGQGKARMLMFHASQLSHIRDAQLLRCLS